MHMVAQIQEMDAGKCCGERRAGDCNARIGCGRNATTNEYKKYRIS